MTSSPARAADDCQHIGLVVFVPGQDEVEEGQSIEFEVRREGMPLDEALDLEVSPAPYLNGATLADFAELPEVVTIPAGEESVRFSVATVDDEGYQGNRSVRLTAKPIDGPELPVRLWDTTVGQRGEILDNDEMPTVAVSKALNATEGGPAGGFEITRSGNTSGELWVHYELGLTAGKMAAPGSDFVIPEGAFLLPKSTGGVRVGTVLGSVLMTDGQEKVLVPIEAIDDGVVDEDDHVRINLLGGKYSATNSTDELAIADDDTASASLPKVRVEVLGTEVEPGVTLHTGAAEEGEDGEPESAAFTISRTDSQGDLTVAFTLSGTAEMGRHFEEIPLEVTIPDGKKSAEVLITPINDGVGTCFLYPGALASRTDLSQQSARSVFLQIGESAAYQVTDERAQLTVNDSEDLACWLRDLCPTRESFAVGVPASFIGSAQVTRNSIEKVELAHEWDFGDGTVCEMADVFDAQAHVYAEPGTYTVSLTAIASTTFSSNMDSFAMSQSAEITVGESGEVVSCAAIGPGSDTPGTLGACTGPGCPTETGGGDDGDGSVGNGDGTDSDEGAMQDGCGCRSAGSSPPSWWWGALLLAPFALGTRRRRQRLAERSGH